MKRKSLVTIFILALFGVSFAGAPSQVIRYVYDGDTAVLATGEEVRYLGIDAPEIGHCGEKSDFMALESKNYNMNLVRNASIRLEFDEERKDRYGRLLAYVYLENGDMVNRLLVRNGFAWVLVKKPNMKYFSRLLECQRQAITEKIGIWNKPPERKEPYYLASRDSYRFHRPDCPLGRKIARRNLVRFDSPEKAYWEGYSPCRECKP
jgi:micrococcal nuclease